MKKKIIKYYSKDLYHEISPDFIHLPGVNDLHYNFKNMIYDEYEKNKSKFIKPNNINLITCATEEYDSILIDQCNYMNIDYINAYQVYENKEKLYPWKNSNKLYVYRNIFNKFLKDDIIVLLDSRDVLIYSFDNIRKINKNILENNIIFGTSLYNYPLNFNNILSKHNYKNLLQANLNSGVIIGKQKRLIDLFDDAINALESGKYNDIKLNNNYLFSDQYIFKCLRESDKYGKNIILDELSDIIFTANGFIIKENDNEIVFESKMLQKLKLKIR